MEKLVQNWFLVVACIAATAYAAYAIYRFIKQPMNSKLQSVKCWLLAAVTAAEKQFGSGTGSIKLSYVYNQFLQVFPSLSKIVSFEKFSSLVDEVLDKFRVMLQSNKNLQEYIEK